MVWFGGIWDAGGALAWGFPWSVRWGGTYVFAADIAWGAGVLGQGDVSPCAGRPGTCLAVQSAMCSKEYTMSDFPARRLETGTTDLLACLEEGILTLSFNRPHARNAITGALNAALQQQLAQAETDPAVRCIVLTGAGPAFCAGGDVKGMAAGQGMAGPMSVDQKIHRQRLDQRATAGQLFKMPKPTLAAIPGPAAGAGLSLALACDLRVMAHTAVLTTAFARLGYSGDYGGSFFLTNLVGTAKARELYYLSDRVSAQEALRLGMVNWVCDPEALAAKTREIALRLASGPTVAYRYMKENLNRALTGNVDECMDLEASHHRHCGMTEDHQEAVRAFVEKRPPRFKGV